jgi:hypothetical protein
MILFSSSLHNFTSRLVGFSHYFKRTKIEFCKLRNRLNTNLQWSLTLRSNFVEIITVHAHRSSISEALFSSTLYSGH